MANRKIPKGCHAVAWKGNLNFVWSTLLGSKSLGQYVKIKSCQHNALYHISLSIVAVTIQKGLIFIKWTNRGPKGRGIYPSFIRTLFTPFCWVTNQLGFSLMVWGKPLKNFHDLKMFFNVDLGHNFVSFVTTSSKIKVEEVSPSILMLASEESLTIGSQCWIIIMIIRCDAPEIFMDLCTIQDCLALAMTRISHRLSVCSRAHGPCHFPKIVITLYQKSTKEKWNFEVQF